jgi:type VI protein secretion system component Hcp
MASKTKQPKKRQGPVKVRDIEAKKNAKAGKVNVQDFNFTKTVDKSTPLLH